MSEQLRQAFRELADGAPAIDSTEAASATTWRQARRARQRGVAAIALSVVAVLVGGTVFGLSLASQQQSAPTVSQPYDPSKLAIPTQVWMPSPWTAGTEEAGPIGPLALIATAPHRTSWFHTDPAAVFGVSAATGQYRFIDLPDADLDSGSFGPDIALSPDGTKIGYILLGNLATAASQPNDLGYAVYDTVTGRVTTHRVPTRYGLLPSWLAFTGDSRELVFSYGQWAGETSPSSERLSGSRNTGGGSRSGRTVAWQPTTNIVTPLGGSLGSDQVASGVNGINIFGGRRRTVLTIDAQTGVRQPIRVSRSGETNPTFSPNGRAIAFGASVVFGDGWQTSSTGETASPAVLVARRPATPGAPWRTSTALAKLGSTTCTAGSMDRMCWSTAPSGMASTRSTSRRAS